MHIHINLDRLAQTAEAHIIVNAFHYILDEFN